jgi:hypothetical protein
MLRLLFDAHTVQNFSLNGTSLAVVVLDAVVAVAAVVVAAGDSTVPSRVAGAI